MHLFYQPDLSSGSLTDEDSRHAIKVLRLTSGDQIELTDGKGALATAEIVNPDPHATTYRTISTSRIARPSFSIHLIIAPTKNADRMEWMLEKVIEIGIDHISFVRCKTSERKEVNMERMHKVAVSAIKQSRQAWLPVLTPMCPIEDFLAHAHGDQTFIAHVDANNQKHLKHVAQPNKDTLILIGPEGDFNSTELEIAKSKGWVKVSLGPHRLRTETAGLAAVMTLQLINVS